MSLGLVILSTTFAVLLATAKLYMGASVLSALLTYSSVGVIVALLIAILVCSLHPDKNQADIA